MQQKPLSEFGIMKRLRTTLPRRATLAARLPELAELVDQLESIVARAA